MSDDTQWWIRIGVQLWLASMVIPFVSLLGVLVYSACKNWKDVKELRALTREK